MLEPNRPFSVQIIPAAQNILPNKNLSAIFVMYKNAVQLGYYNKRRDVWQG